jgi:RNA-directed DNA polymerase
VKPLEIGKRLIYEAWEKARADKGAPGVDAVSIGLSGQQWRDNLCQLWNTMSWGSCFPGPVRGVEIPKDQGEGVRLPGVPDTADRVAQTAAAMLLEGKLEPVFHPGSYGYRPGRSAHDALAVCRQRCWKQDWVPDLGIGAFPAPCRIPCCSRRSLTTPASGGSCSASPGGSKRRCRCRTGPSSREKGTPRGNTA